MAQLPDLKSLPALDTESRATVLDTLFEPCTQLHTLSVSLLHEQTFSSYNNLTDAVGDQLRQLQQSDLESDHKWLEAILSAHPRLGEKKVDSEQSRKEQAQLNQGGEEEAEKLAELNRKYEEKFTGLRYVYVLCLACYLLVRGRLLTSSQSLCQRPLSPSHHGRHAEAN
jgi:2-oxo-4-hydroxy-4-carboxy--5-ureidoimidazoline (OHCU) decarboxylase